ncbi:MAG TPA: hypothetical protein VMH23_12720 [Bacteroidota bacterium]|nr:hypothetical protein [Bacteroidota bacterium]
MIETLRRRPEFPGFHRCTRFLFFEEIVVFVLFAEKEIAAVMVVMLFIVDPNMSAFGTLFLFDIQFIQIFW